MKNSEKYLTKEDRLQAFYEMCDRNFFRGGKGKETCKLCKYRETCGHATNRANAILSWLEDEVEDIPYEITRTYTKTIILKAVSEDEARRFANRKFKELEETNTIKEASLKCKSVDKVVPDLPGRVVCELED
jgi:tRNA(Ile)-lysidine synthase TilS/MesJ